MRAEYYYYSAGGIDVALSDRSGSITERRFVFYLLREVKEILRTDVSRKAGAFASLGINVFPSVEVKTRG